jgi:hypothetical protein
MWILECVDAHKIIANSPTELDTLLFAAECPICKKSFRYVAPEIPIGCPFCYHNESHDLEDALGMIGNNCYVCNSSEFYIVDSSRYDYKSSFELGEIEREDYWELLVHFTSYENFKQIILQKTIKVNKTGLYGIPAINLTEIPPQFGHGFREKFGNWGIVFSKEQIIKAGGMPSIYMPKNLLQEFTMPDRLKPFVNVVSIDERKINFIHEREWRVDKNILLSEVVPLGLITAFGYGNSCPDYSDILDIVMKYRSIDY